LPAVIGHRGIAALAPENTLAGLRQARSYDCAWVEFDVRLCADGALILLHDDRLERTTDGSGRASALPLSAVRRHDAGSWFDSAFAGERVPTLGEALAVLGELGLGANVELKAERGHAAATGAAAAELLSRSWPARLPPPLLSSFLPEALAAAQQHAPGIARGILFHAVPRDWRRVAAGLGCASVHADHRALRPSLVGEIRAAGYPVLAYTVNDPARAQRLFEWGVTSVFSDVPHIILAAIGEGSSRQPVTSALNSLAQPREGVGP
jgi:glycerophosphoryl diester phosphodiesterase